MKPYELTDKEISKIVSNSYDADPWDSSESAAREAENAAQKKLLEYLKSECMLDHFIDNFITGECHSTCKSCQLLKDFGL